MNKIHNERIKERKEKNMYIRKRIREIKNEKKKL